MYIYWWLWVVKELKKHISSQCSLCGLLHTFLGYSGNGYSCSDIDECLVDNGGCSRTPYVECVNTQGSHTCGGCPPGYSGSGRFCSYVGYCVVNNGGCHPMATCIEQSGNYWFVFCISNVFLSFIAIEVTYMYRLCTLKYFSVSLTYYF